MDVLLALSAWGTGSVIASLAIGAVIARRDRSAEAGHAPGEQERPARRALGTSTAPLRLVDAR